MKKKKIKITRKILLLLILLLLVSWAIRVFYINYSYRKKDGVEIKNYVVGEWVPYEGEYAYGEFPENYEICVTNYEIKDTDDYLKEKNLDANSFEYLTDRICLVEILVRNNSNNEGSGLYLTDIWLYGTDFYLGQNTELFTVENPNMDNAGGILLSDGKECNLTLVYNVDKLYFTKYAWNHMESLEMSLYLTAFPIQKNIVLHD